MKGFKLFIKNYEYKNFKSKFVFLIAMNAIDMVLTYIGISNMYSEEINFILKPYVMDLNIMTTAKVVFPTVAFLVIYNRMKTATKEQLRISNYFVNGALIFYAAVVLSHLGWITMATLSLIYVY